MRHLTALPSDADGHVEAELPWYVNGTLDAADRAHVDEHLAGCERCRASHDLEKRLAGILRAPRDTLDCAPQSGWTQLAARLARSSPVARDAEEPAPATQDASGVRTRRRASPATAAIVFAQAAAIGILSFLLLQLITDKKEDAFRTLTQSAGVTVKSDVSTVRIVFAEDTPAAQIGTLLRTVGGTITAGPSTAGVYTVELRDAPPSADDPVSAADWLRAQPGVLFAEPVGLPAAR